MKIPMFKPLIEEAEIEAAVQSLRMGWLGMGSCVGEFESALARFVEAEDRRVVAVSTGHAALHLALLAAGIGPGDEVITPAFNNIADFQAILAVGAIPVFCDIFPETLCLDLRQAEKLISKRTKALIAMDYACHLCDHEHVRQLAADKGLRVIHDAAHSFGSRYKSQPVGSFSDITMFSFDPVKNITCIDGGALVVRTSEEAEFLTEARLIGMGQPSTVMYQNQRAWTYDVRRLGYRYHLPNLHAAIGLSQLAQMEIITTSRRAACRRYNELLHALSGVRTPATDFAEITPFLYYLRVPRACREEFRAELARHGVDTGIHWQPGHWFTLFRDCPRGDLEVTDAVGREIVSLPLHSRMHAETVEQVCRVIASFFSSSEIRASA